MNLLITFNLYIIIYCGPNRDSVILYTIHTIFIIQLQLMFWRFRRDFYCYEVVKRRSLTAVARHTMHTIEISQAFSIRDIMLLYELNSETLWICVSALSRILPVSRGALTYLGKQRLVALSLFRMPFAV